MTFRYTVVSYGAIRARRVHSMFIEKAKGNIALKPVQLIKRGLYGVISPVNLLLRRFRSVQLDSRPKLAGIAPTDNEETIQLSNGLNDA